MEAQAELSVRNRRSPAYHRGSANGSFSAVRQDHKARLSYVLQRLACWREDQQAWALLYEELSPILMARNHRLLRTAGDLVEDAIQEVFLRLFRYCKLDDKLTDPDAFCAYVRVICRNVVTQLSQRERRERYEKHQLWEITKLGFKSTRPDQQAEARELLQRLIGCLRETDRQMLDLLIEGSSLREIAQTTGLHYFTAGARLSRLRARLAGILSRRAKKQVEHRFTLAS